MIVIIHPDYLDNYTEHEHDPIMVKIIKSPTSVAMERLLPNHTIKIMKV